MTAATQPDHRPRPEGRDNPARRRRRWIVGGAAIAALAGSALLNRANGRRAEARTPPPGRFVEVDGARLHYVDRGNGPVVVLLHGNGVMLQDFIASGVLDRLAISHRVIAFDRPGFGYSDRPRTTLWTPGAQAGLIVRALTRIGVERAVVVGHSWGTLVALEMALDHRPHVAGLVLMSGYYYGTARLDVVPASVVGAPVLGDAVAHTVSPLLGALAGPIGVKTSFAPAPVAPTFAAFPAALALRPSQMRAAGADAAMMIPSAVRLSRQYRNLALPVVVMAGEGDRIVDRADHSERLAKDLPDADLRVISGQGHLFHYAAPDQVASAVDTIVERAGLRAV